MNRRILFTQRVLIKEDYGERWDCADQRITSFIRACGFVPIPVPNCAESIRDFFVAVQPVGIVLTGGNSLVKYGGDAPERDATDEACIRIAIENCIPIYGFCRGMQSLLDYFGEKISNVEGHIAVRHGLAGIIQRTVNSYHGQACMGLNTDIFDVLARTEDGVIEAVRHRKYRMLGTMWHPEREAPFLKEDIRMVRELFEDDKGEDSW